MTHYCDACRKEGASNRCGKCHVTFYCNADCQRERWSVHKNICSMKLRETASPCPQGFVDVLIATGDKNTTRFERWQQAEETEERSEPKYEDLKKIFRSFDAAGLGQCADAYCEDTFDGLVTNPAARALMLAVDLKPPSVLYGPVLIQFRDGICRQGKTSIQLARQWYQAFMLDDAAALFSLVAQTPEDRQRHAARAVASIDAILNLHGSGQSEEDQSEYWRALKEQAIKEDAGKWQLFYYIVFRALNLKQNQQNAFDKIWV